MIPLLFFILGWVAFLLLLFNPVLLVVSIIFVILFKILSTVFDNIIYSIKDSLYNSQRVTIAKEKWIDNLRNGKRVPIGDVTLQCKNQSLIINEKIFSINEIKNLELKYKVLNVKKTTIDNSANLWCSNRGYDPQIIMKDKTMTIEEYKKDIELTNAAAKESEERYNIYYYPWRYKYQYKFDKEYYISITLYNGHNELCPIAFCTNCDKEILNAPNEESLVLELNNYINSLKIKA